MRSISFFDLENFDVGMIDRDVVALDKLQAVKFVGQEESTVDDIFQLEIRTKHFLIEVIFLLAEFLGIIPPVPGLEFKAVALGGDELLKSGGFLAGSFDGRLPDLVEEIIDSTGRLGHAVIEDIVSPGLEAEEIGFFQAQGDGSGDVGFVVVGIVVVAAVDVGLEDFFAKVAARRILQEGNHARLVEGKNPLAGQATLGRCFGSGGDDIGGQTFEVSLIVDDQLVGVGIFENVVSEFKLENSQFLIDFFEAGFLRLVEVGTGPDKILVESFEELTLLGSKREVASITLLIDCLEAGEELRVEIYLVVMLGENRGQVGGDGLKFIVGVG